MKYILEITPHTNEDNVFYKSVEWDTLKIGRGYSNNIILNDPYLDAEHVEIFRDGEDLFIEDLNTVNGIKVNSKKRDISKIVAGDVINLGSTKIRVLSPDAEVAPAVKILDKRFVFSWIEKQSSAWISLLVLVVLMKLWAFTEVWPRKEHSLIELIIISSAVGMVIVWSLLWAIASRFIRYKANFRCHITIFSAYLSLSVFVWYFHSYVMFLTNENMVADIISYLTNFIMFSLLIYVSLMFTSNMRESKNLVFAGIFSASIVCGMISVDYLSSAKFDLRPSYSGSMEPYLSGLIKADSLDDFMKDNEKLFSSKVLNKIQK